MKNTLKKLGIRGLYVTVGALTLAAVVLVNIVAGALSDRYPLSVDLTPGKLFELSADTASYIATLDRPVAIQVLATQERFENTSVYNAQASKIMSEFTKRSSSIGLSYIDYVSDPAFASRYPDLTLKHGDVLVTCGDRVRHVKTEELFEYSYTSSGSLAIAASRAEETILTAILYVVSDDVSKAAFLQGHGEAGLSAFQALLSANNYEISQVNLLTGGLNSDTGLVVLAAPSTDLSSEEIELLDDFLQNGGDYGKTLLYCGAPQQGPLPNLEAFLAEWGVKVGDGLVFETDSARVYSTQPFYAIADYVSESYADLVRDAKVPMLVPVSRPLEVLFIQQESYNTEILLQFGTSTGVRPGDAPEGFTADDATRRGPIPALVLASRRQMDPQKADRVLTQSSVLVSGSTEMLENYAVNSASFANGQYLTDLLGRLCGNEQGVTVVSKRIVGNSLNLNQAQADRIGILFVAVIPVAVLALGAMVWLRRRHQ